MSGNVGTDGKADRQCDSCIRKRARWYCAADDAFLCETCDASVHSANPLARKHQRVRLKIASHIREAGTEDFNNISVPSWHHGFKRKPRSPRKLAGPRPYKSGLSVPLVPELGSDETSQEENEDEQLLYRVPIYDHFDSEIRTSDISEEPPPAPKNAEGSDLFGEERDVKALLAGFGQQQDDNLGEFLLSDVDLADFDADVENLLGGGEFQGMESLGLVGEYCGKVVKLENGYGNGDAYVAFHAGGDDMAGDIFEMSFDVSSPGKPDVKSGEGGDEIGFVKKKRKILLNLDYESVILEWASQRSPWTTGFRPELDAAYECFPDYMIGLGTEMRHHEDMYGEKGGRGMSQQAMGGREARVTRYREKRRTRLFAKKIRYEVRKLNAEKRPRMKGRFVKRASLFGVGVGVASPEIQ